MANMKSASRMMQDLQNTYISSKEEDTEDSVVPQQRDETRRFDAPHRELGFLEGLKFICSAGRVTQHDFPTHIFGIPTSFCIGWDGDDATSQGSYSEDFDEYYDDMEYELGFAPRGRDFLSDLSTILEATTEITRQDTNSTIESVATSKSIKSKVVLVGVKSSGVDGEKKPKTIKEAKGPTEGLYLSAASKANDNILANSTSSQADSTDPSASLNRSASKTANTVLTVNPVEKMPSIIEEDRESVLQMFSLDSDGEPMEGQYKLKTKLEDAKRSFDRAWSFRSGTKSSSGSSSYETGESDHGSGVSQEPPKQQGNHFLRSIGSTRSKGSLRSRSGSKSLVVTASKLISGTDSRGDRSSDRSQSSYDTSTLNGSRENPSLSSREELCNSESQISSAIFPGTEKRKSSLSLKPNTVIESEHVEKLDTPRPKDKMHGKSMSNSQKTGHRGKKRFFGKKKSQDSTSSA